MKKRNLLTVLFLAVLTLTIVSCNKDDDNEEKLDIKEVIIGSWEYENINLSVELDVNEDGVKGTDINEVKPCDRDNYYVFKNTPNMYFVYSGNLNCDNDDDHDDDILVQDSYSFSSDEKKINIPEEELVYTIVDFSKNRLTLSYPTTFKGQNLIVTFYLKRK